MLDDNHLLLDWLIAKVSRPRLHKYWRRIVKTKWVLPVLSSVIGAFSCQHHSKVICNHRLCDEVYNVKICFEGVTNACRRGDWVRLWQRQLSSVWARYLVRDDPPEWQTVLQPDCDKQQTICRDWGESHHTESLLHSYHNIFTRGWSILETKHSVSTISGLFWVKTENQPEQQNL